ncbi:MAG: hypothetical protein ACSHXA_09910 [Polaribacter sp.]|uniref:hypothetical protein n=1 Tax=Polaribacter sp. TaxID=1920175 RepID=UPI003EF08CD9
MYTIESYKQPFWAKSGNFTRGRDPLGIQNSSIAVYSTLLPGMTNLTLRLRYYGFYLWLLDKYHQLPEADVFKQNYIGQYTFIRRAELILAYLMKNKFPNEQSVIGSNFAESHINQFKNIGYYDIALGADKLKDTAKGSVYWDYTSGALGQYYAGSLINLNLINIKENYFERTEEKGKELAESYGVSLSNNCAQLLLERIREGKLYEEDFDELVDISLDKVVTNTPEGDFYIKMLLNNDGEKSKTAQDFISEQRKESIKLFLWIIQNSVESKMWENMPQISYHMCTNPQKEEVSEATYGWYYYYLNEVTHHSLETIFWGLLLEMDNGNYSLQQFLNEITEKVIVYFDTNFNIRNIILGEFIEQLISDPKNLSENINTISKAVKNNDSIEGISYGLLTLLHLFKENSENTKEITDYAINHFLNTKNGNVIEVFERHIRSNKDLELKSFIKKIIHNILNEHIAVAYKKMGDGEKNLLKFLIEDNYLVHIETMQPNFTSPRLKTLYNFTRDLGLVNEHQELTGSGKTILEQLEYVEV